MMMPPVAANFSRGGESLSKQHAPPPPQPASEYRPTDHGDDEFVPVVVSPDRGQPYHRSSFRSLARIPEEPSWPGCSNNKPNNNDEVEGKGARTPNHTSNFYYCHPSRKKKHKLLSSSSSSDDLQQKIKQNSDDSAVCSSSSTSCSPPPPPPLFASDTEVIVNPAVSNMRQQQSQLFDAGLVPGHFVHKPKAAPAALTAPRTPAATAVVPHVLHPPVNDKATSSPLAVPTTPEQTPPRTTTEATSSLLEPPPLIPNHHDYYYYHRQGTGATMAAGGDGVFHQHSSNRAFLVNLPKNHHDHRRPPSVKVNDTTPSLPFLDDMSSCHDHDEKDDDEDNANDDDDCRELASLSSSPRFLQKRSSSSSTANSQPPLLLPPCLAIL